MLCILIVVLRILLAYSGKEVVRVRHPVDRSGNWWWCLLRDSVCFLTRWSKIKILVLTTCFLYTRDRVAKYSESELLVLLSQQIRRQTFGKTKTAREKGRKSLQKVHPPCQKNLWVRNISSLTPYSSSTQGSFADIHRLFQQKNWLFKHRKGGPG